MLILTLNLSLEWMGKKLTEIQGEAPEDMFLEYISIMVI